MGEARDPIDAAMAAACAEIERLRAELETERTARKNAEQLAVWAVRNEVEVASFWFGPGDETDILRHTMIWTGGKAIGIDGSDAGILAALRRAMDEEK